MGVMRHRRPKSPLRSRRSKRSVAWVPPRLICATVHPDLTHGAGPTRHAIRLTLVRAKAALDPSMDTGWPTCAREGLQACQLSTGWALPQRYLRMHGDFVV